MKNSETVGKYIIVDNLNFGGGSTTDFMKDENENIVLYDTEREAREVCGMYEFPDALVLRVVFNHIESE